MYGEDSDLCLRAAKLGYRPMITPDAQIIHLAGAASPTRQDKLVMLMRGKATLIRDHWCPLLVRPGLALLWLWAGTRRLFSALFLDRGRSAMWKAVWQKRKVWLAGYQE
jgi:GT2 family glycosyltransferase